MVAEMTNLTIYITFMIVNLSLIMLRYIEPDAKRIFKVPLSIGKTPILPVIGIALVLFMMFHLDLLIIEGGIIFILIGFVFYRWFDFFTGWKKKKKAWKP